MLDLPFFEPRHRALAGRLPDALNGLAEWATDAERRDPVAAGREAVRLLAGADLLDLLAPSGAGDPGGPTGSDLRALCLAREALAGVSAFADSVFAVDGLGAHPILRFGTAEQRQRYLPGVRAGDLVGAFALTEPEAGSDVSGLETTARRDGVTYVLDGTKTFISNAGLADFYVVFAVTGGDGGRKELSGFVVDAGTPGFEVDRDIELLAPHPIGTLRFAGCRIPAGSRVGGEGAGRRVAFATLDQFRPSVGAAACGLAARALQEARAHVARRRQFGSTLAGFQATRLAVADMATELDAARLLVYRAAWLKDQGRDPIPREASMAKLFATEAAQRVVDRAVQLHGGTGVRKGAVVERLYREVRALRIYEGTSEIQRLIIAGQELGGRGDP